MNRVKFRKLDRANQKAALVCVASDVADMANALGEGALGVGAMGRNLQVPYYKTDQVAYIPTMIRSRGF